MRLRLWSRIHTWSSLACTAFLLLLCLTGLPLIFHDEIGELTTDHVAPAALPPGTPDADLDAVVAAARAARPGEVVQYLIWEDDDPAVRIVRLAPTPISLPDTLRTVRVDARTAQVLDQPRDDTGFLYWMIRLHADLFLGVPGKLFLGAMGLLFIAALVSGAVLYGPFARHGSFGAVRSGRGARVAWLDRHNVLGIVTLAWTLLIGATGVINTLGEQALAAWRADELAATVAPWRGQPPVDAPGSVQAAVDAARAAAPPGMTVFFVAWPQTMFTSGHHYGVYLRGDGVLTKRLLIPALVDARTGALTDLQPMPWYVTALLLSQPLHFGDFGGLPLKLVWAVLDVATIVLLGSGLWLWWARRRQPAPRSRAIAAE